MSKESNEKARNFASNLIARFFSIFSSNDLNDSKEVRQSSKFLFSWLTKRELAQQVYQEESKELLENNLFLVGKVIFRTVHSWNSTVWIDIGYENNPKNGPCIIAKNSPVLSGNSVVGVVDYVGEKTSLVRLITDSGLNPAVRVSRGAAQKARLLPLIQELEITLCKDSSLFENKELQTNLATELLRLKRKISSLTDTKKFFAKGELQGSGEPLYRSSGAHLKGVGFNYDFSDSKGPAKGLRPQALDEPMIQVGDLLVTSGLDGIFPEGLHVAIVESLSPLREGAYSYELIAKPTALNILDLSYVSVIAPVHMEEIHNFAW